MRNADLLRGIALSVAFGSAPLRPVCSAIAQQNAATAPGQAAPGYSATLFKASVRRVLVDVIVTDSKGQPVRGLTKADFSVAEDGRPQEVLSFDASGFDEGMDYLPPKLPPPRAPQHLH
jgi:hypothetical protein